MKNIDKEFKLYAVKHRGISSTTFDKYSRYVSQRKATLIEVAKKLINRNK